MTKENIPNSKRKESEHDEDRGDGYQSAGEDTKEEHPRGRSGGHQANNQQRIFRDPYALLNLSPETATDADIQRAYKRGSRALHPDKQAASLLRTGEISESAAQEAFVAFKEAYDILSDPVLRQAYDNHGIYGVSFIRNVRDNEKREELQLGRHDKSLYRTLLRMHQSNESDKALQLLTDAIQHQRNSHYCRIVPMHARFDVHCSTINSLYWLNGGKRHADATFWPEVTNTNMGLDLSIVPSHVKEAEANKGYHNKWSITLGANTSVKKGKGVASGKAKLGYEISPGTDIMADIDVGENAQVDLSSSRSLSSGTDLTVGLRSMSTEENKNSLLPRISTELFGLYCSTQRLLYGGQIHGSCDLGIQSNLRTQYLQVTCTTLLANLPRFKLNLNIGLERFPIRMTVTDTMDRYGGEQDHRCSLSLALAPHAIEVVADSNRKLSKDSGIGIGVRHNSFDGLTLTVQLSRGTDAVIKIPIKIASQSSISRDLAYPWKMAYTVLVAALLDLVIGDNVHDGRNAIWGAAPKDNAEEKQKAPEADAAWLREQERLRKLAEQQLCFMRQGAELSRQKEELSNGLIILNAIYYVDGDENSCNLRRQLDVRNQIQFWVENSSLFLPGGSSKSNLMGFYCLARNHSSTTDLSCRQAQRLKPMLYIRYSHSNGIYEITIKDEEELSLPSANALRIGDKLVVQ